MDICLQETDQEKVAEVRTPRRGRSSKSTEEVAKDQPKEPELEETPSRRGRRSGATAKETPAGKMVTLDWKHS